MAERIKQAQIIALPGGYAAFGEPDGFGKFAVNYFLNPRVRDAFEEFLNARKGLAVGVGTGFQALLRLGLIPYGEFREMTEDSPVLAGNMVGRHVSTAARVKVVSVLSPWFSGYEADEAYSTVVSTGEGRFAAEKAVIERLAANGQVAAQYMDMCGGAVMDVVSTVGSTVEAVTSPDGRVLGKLGHCERYADGLFKNLPGGFDRRIFEAGVGYYR
jgi:phosphoribosylformylglycinamidine synthase